MIVVENLSFGYPWRPLFEGLSLKIQPGDLVHVAGCNGLGKTTFLRLLAGLLRPKAGCIKAQDSWAGQDLRRLIEFLPADTNGLFGSLNVWQNLSFWSGLRGQALSMQESQKALELWGLNTQPYINSMPVQQFSTGMKRRLALARVSLSPAPVWLLDEPVSGLDAQSVAVFRQVLNNHLAQQGAALVVSHDLNALQGLGPKSFDLQGGAV